MWLHSLIATGQTLAPSDITRTGRLCACVCVAAADGHMTLVGDDSRERDGEDPESQFIYQTT